MSKGFITLGINTEVNKIKYCYGLALSIKGCDPEAEVCLVVDKGKVDEVPKEYHHVLDYIVELPYGNTAYKDGFHGMNLWQLYHCSPFEENIYLDADTLMHNVKIEDLWNLLSKNEMSIPKNAFSYRNLPADPRMRFEFEETYKLPQFYNNLIYWKHGTQTAEEWFKLADPILQDWRSVYNNFFQDKKPDTFNKNVLCNLITHYGDLKEQVQCFVGNHYDIHSDNQGVWYDEVPDNWTEMINYWVSDNGKVQIENSIISSGIIHYTDENFLTDEVIDVYRTNIINKQSRT